MTGETKKDLRKIWEMNHFILDIRIHFPYFFLRN